MKPVKASVSRGLNVGSRLVCADNTGAKIVEIISVFGYKGVKRRQPAAGVANMIKVTVKEGDMVLFKKYGPDEVELDGKKYLVGDEGDILAILE